MLSGWWKPVWVIIVTMMHQIAGKWLRNDSASWQRAASIARKMHGILVATYQFPNTDSRVALTCQFAMWKVEGWPNSGEIFTLIITSTTGLPQVTRQSFQLANLLELWRHTNTCGFLISWLDDPRVLQTLLAQAKPTRKLPGPASPHEANHFRAQTKNKNLRWPV